MKLLVGLGNPGSEYLHTRHNMGFLAIERCAELAHASPFVTKSAFTAEVADARAGGERVIFAKPQTFMNDSGTSIKNLADYFHIAAEDIWVLHDELDLAAGTIRLAFESRSAGHNGVQSIIDALGTNAFHRVRIGIGPKPENVEADVFVLAKMSDEEERDARASIDAALPDILRDHLNIS